MTEPPPVTPDQFAAMVAGMSDEQLSEGLAANRDTILPLIFEQMPTAFSPEAAQDVEAVLEWRIRRPGGGHDAWQLTIDRGTCRVERHGEATPVATFTMDPLDFVKLAAGKANGPELFIYGKLTVEGDLVTAARVQTMFRPPSA